MNVSKKFRPGHSYLHPSQALLRLVEVAVMPQEAARASLRARQSIPLGGGGSSGGTEDKQWAGRRQGLVMSKDCNELPRPPCFHVGVEEKKHIGFVQRNDCGQSIGNSQADSAGVCGAE